MENAVIVDILRQYARQLNELQEQYLAEGSPAGAADILLALFGLQQEMVIFIRSVLVLYAQSDPELAEVLRSRLFELDLQDLLGRCRIRPV